MFCLPLDTNASTKLERSVLVEFLFLFPKQKLTKKSLRLNGQLVHSSLLVDNGLAEQLATPQLHQAVPGREIQHALVARALEDELGPLACELVRIVRDAHKVERLDVDEVGPVADGDRFVVDGRV
jgi:hypothetical protein